METLLQSEGLPDVIFSGVEGKCEFVGRRLRVPLILSIFVAEEDERAYYLKSQAQRKQKYLKGGRKVRGQDKVIGGLLSA